VIHKILRCTATKRFTEINVDSFDAHNAGDVQHVK